MLVLVEDYLVVFFNEFEELQEIILFFFKFCVDKQMDNVWMKFFGYLY